MTTLTTGVATTFIDFTRASNATVTDSDGLVKWAPHNLLTNSESFDAASWTKLNATITANSVSAPNGTTTADKVIEAVTNGLHCPYNNSITGSSNTSYTLSVFAKAAERTWITLILGDGFPAVNLARASFNLATGAVGTVGSSATAYPPVDVGNGWWLCRISATSIGTTFGSYLCTASADDTYSYVGDITKGIYIWGASLYRSDLAMQPNTSAYPLYNPTTPKNLLGYTEDFSNAAWAVATGTATKTSNTDIAPNGLQTADTLAATSANTIVWQIYVPIVDCKYTGSIYLKRKSGSGTVQITVDGSAFTTVALTTSWERFSLTYTAAAGSKAVGVKIVTSGDEVLVWGAQLSDSASLDAYSPVYGAAVTSAAYYGPRRDFDPVTLACKGLLVEEQRTNQFLYSDQFDNTSYWSTTGAVTAGMANAAVAPTGTSVADALTEDTSTGVHRVYGAVTLTAATYTLSFYAKANGRNWIYIYTDGGTTAGTVNFTTNTYVPLTGTATVSSVLVGNSWYRVTYTFSNTITSSQNIQLWLATNGTTSSYTGDGTSGIYLFGAQIELGSFATSYIPTGAAVGGATRLADVASVSTQAFPYSASASSIVIALQHLSPTSTGTNQGHWILELSGSSVVAQDRYLTSSNIAFRGLSLNVDSGKSVGTAVAKVGTTFSTGDVALVVNGGSAYTNTSATGSQSADKLTLGRSSFASTEYINGYIRQVTYLPRRISNTELQTRTA